MGLLEWARAHGDVRKPEVAPLETDGPGFGQRLDQDLQALIDQTAAILGAHPEGLVLLRRESPADAKLKPSPGQDVEGRGAFGHLQRVMVGERHNAMTQADTPGPLCGGRQEQVGGRAMRILRHEVVLGEPCGPEPQAIGQGDLFQCFFIHLPLAAPREIRHRQLIEKVEFHRSSEALEAP
ncbi:hypothetical protein C4901_03040 [Acidiferrobacter sp. SPIII_3]|nr:hypothetical protein C4901_03040 [Acidiferrobacter sp. SPIII_3]